MTGFGATGTLRLFVAGLIIFLTTPSPALLQLTHGFDTSASPLNCTTTETYININPTKASRLVLESKEEQQDSEQQNGNYNYHHSNRYLDDPTLDKYTDEISRRLEEENSNRNHDPYPYGRHREDDKYVDRYDHDYEVRRRFYEEQSSRRSSNEEDDNKDLKVRPLGRHFEDQQSKEDKQPDSRQLERYPSEDHSEKNLQVRPLSRNQDDHHTSKYPDNHDAANRFANDYDLNRHVSKNQKNFDDHQPTWHSNIQNPNKNLQVYPTDSHPDRPPSVDDESSLNKNHDDHLSKNQDNQRASESNDRERRPTTDQYPNKHYDAQTNSDSKIEEGSDRITKNKDNQRYSDLYPESHYPTKHLDDLYPDRRVSDQNYERQLVDQHPDRRLTFQDPIAVDQQQPDRYRPSEKRPDQHNNNNHRQSSSERFDDREKRPNDPNFERRLGDPVPDKNYDDGHLDRRLDNPIVEGRADETDAIRPDRRLSEDDYNSHVTFKQSSLEHEDKSHESDVKIEKLHPESRFDDRIPDDDDRDGHDDDDDLYKGPRMESNVSHLVNFDMSNNWDEFKPRLNFPKKSGTERYKMATLHLDKGLFVFDFLRHVLSVLLPRNVPLDLLKDTIEGKVNVSTLISKSIHLELVFFAVVIILALLMFVIPSTECYLCCKPHVYKYKRTRQGPSVCFLCIFAIVIGACVITMLVTNEQVATGVERIPETIDAALQDLQDYNSGTANQLRRCMTRSLDVASEAILADLDNVEELLGKPVQAQLSQETGVDVAIEALMDVANASQELAYKTDGLLKRAERAREFGNELSREADDLRRELERTTRDCAPEDRSLCAVLDPSGLHLALRLERLARDDRLLRLRTTSRDNLTEVGRQARGEYLYVPHHVARSTLEARNRIRREINTARAKVSDEARSIEASGSDLSNHLDQVRRVKNQVVPYVQQFERIRRIVGFATAMVLFFLWLILFAALLCRCGCCEHKVRPTLLWFACLSCLLSIALWLVLISALAIASHAEMLLCRPLDDPEYRTVEAVLETRVFLGRRMSVPLRDLFEKCEQHGSVYSGYQLDSTLKLEQLTAHWSWAGLSRAFGRLKVDLTGMRILSPNLRERLQNLLYAAGSNLTEHRVMIQGPILNKDLNALSDQVENVARQLSDRRTARSFQTIAVQMRDLLSRRVKPLMKTQDELVYQLAALEVHLHPLQRKVNETLAQLRTVQYHIDNQGEKIGQLKTKAYVDRLTGYLDQWRAHVLTEVSSGVSKCRPLWDIMRGIKLLFCSHILGPLNGYWFSLFVSVVTLLICTPTAHNLASSYWTAPSSSRKSGSVLLSRQGSPDTVVIERETWQTPRPAPSLDSW